MESPSSEIAPFRDHQSADPAPQSTARRSVAGTSGNFQRLSTLHHARPSSFYRPLSPLFVDEAPRDGRDATSARSCRPVVSGLLHVGRGGVDTERSQSADTQILFTVHGDGEDKASCAIWSSSSFSKGSNVIAPPRTGRLPDAAAPLGAIGFKRGVATG